MQKVYLLLRNNQQTGPFTLEEMVQVGLQPLDLVWVEGKSAGWSYPAEIEALKPYVPQNTAVEKKSPEPTVSQHTLKPIEKRDTPKKIYVCMPKGKSAAIPPVSAVDPIEQKAEELRRRAQAYIPTTAAIKETTTYAPSLDVEENNTSWLYRQKTKKKSIPGKKLVVFVALIAAIVIGGGWALKTFILAPKVPIQKETVVQHAMPDSEDFQQTSDNDSTTTITDTDNQPLPIVANFKTVEKQGVPEKGLKSKETKEAQVPVTAANDEVQTPMPEAPQKEDKVVPAPTAPNTETAQTKKEKKTLKEAVSGLFNKKVVEDKDRRVVESNGERTARRRDDEPVITEKVTINLADHVQVKSNQPNENWMLGIKGLKLTVYNRSSSTVEKAAVELVYYSEQNDVMDKKIITFSNIGPKKSQSITAPDNRLADHAEYKLISASGWQEGYANQ